MLILKKCLKIVSLFLMFPIASPLFMVLIDEMHLMATAYIVS